MMHAIQEKKNTQSVNFLSKYADYGSLPKAKFIVIKIPGLEHGATDVFCHPNCFRSI